MLHRTTHAPVLRNQSWAPFVGGWHTLHVILTSLIILPRAVLHDSSPLDALHCLIFISRGFFALFFFLG